MQQKQVIRLVREYLVKELEIDPEKIHPDANLFEDLEMDSIDTLDCIVHLESELKIGIVEDELKKIRTVQDVVDYIIRHQPQED